MSDKELLIKSKELLIKRFKWYWEIRNGKFKAQIRPICHFLTKHLRKSFPRGTAPKIISRSPIS